MISQLGTASGMRSNTPSLFSEANNERNAVEISESDSKEGCRGAPSTTSLREADSSPDMTPGNLIYTFGINKTKVQSVGYLHGSVFVQTLAS